MKRRGLYNSINSDLLTKELPEHYYNGLYLRKQSNPCMELKLKCARKDYFGELIKTVEIVAVDNKVSNLKLLITDVDHKIITHNGKEYEVSNEYYFTFIGGLKIKLFNPLRVGKDDSYIESFVVDFEVINERGNK